MITTPFHPGYLTADIFEKVWTISFLSGEDGDVNMSPVFV